MKCPQSTDILIIGAGLAGLSLARHLLLETDRRILLIEKLTTIPPSKQKVGESLVQVGGYYFAKVLDLEEHLLHDHFMKYNLRFYFNNESGDASQFENYSQAFIQNFSNIPCYQLDRLAFETELLRLNQLDERFSLVTGVRNVNPTVNPDGRHTTEFSHAGELQCVHSDWIVDTTGRARLMQRKHDLQESSPIKHGAAFMWVDGLVDVEKLTDSSLEQRRKNPNKRQTGHLPHWLATNHFMDEGLWLWVIPLRGKTSIGLVFDHQVVSIDEVNSAEKLTVWITQRFPLFARALEDRQVVDFSAVKDFAHGAKETINGNRWAVSGVSGRFNDPLYSPGSDFISLHNTMIVDAIKLTRPTDVASGQKNPQLRRKCWLYELVMQSYYRSLLPSFATSYNALGDHETFVMKYTWELSVYFSFFVFPFINDLHTSSAFLPNFLSRFSKLGSMNAGIQKFLSDYYRWKKRNRTHSTQPAFHDLTDLEPLQRAEKTFYEVDLTVQQAKEVLTDQLNHLTELGRFIVAHICSVVADDYALITNADFVQQIDLKDLKFDPATIRLKASSCTSSQRHCWTFDSEKLKHFYTSSDTLGQPAVEVSVTSGSQ